MDRESIPTDPAGEAERPGFFARVAIDLTPLRGSPPFRRLWFGTGISAIGSQITAGAVADAVDRRRVPLLSDVALLLVAAGLLVNALLPDPRVWFLFVAEAVGTAAYGFQRPARNALTPRLVPPEQLTAAIAVEDAVSNLSRIAGPALGGVLIAALGLGAAYAIDLVSFAASLLAIWGAAGHAAA